MTSSWKTYRVRFSVRDCYLIEVKARSSGEAERKAADLYETHGESSLHGFQFDISDGGTEGWEAEEMPS